MVSVGHGMIDGDRWIAERLAFLRGVLTTEISDEQRNAIEDEIQKLSKERGIHIGGFRLPWFPSRWIGRRRDMKPEDPQQTSSDPPPETPAP
jgi:hypothetical protein